MCLCLIRWAARSSASRKLSFMQSRHELWQHPSLCSLRQSCHTKCHLQLLEKTAKRTKIHLFHVCIFRIWHGTPACRPKTELWQEQCMNREPIYKHLQSLEARSCNTLRKGIHALLLQQKGYTNQEISKHYGVPMNHVRAWQSKARKYLQQDTKLYTLLSWRRTIMLTLYTAVGILRFQDSIKEHKHRLLSITGRNTDWQKKNSFCGAASHFKSDRSMNCSLLFSNAWKNITVRKISPLNLTWIGCCFEDWL